MALPHNWIWFQFSLGEQEIMIFIYYLLSTRTDPWAFFPLVRWNASLLFSLSRFTPSFFRIHQKQPSIWSRLQGNFFLKIIWFKLQAENYKYVLLFDLAKMLIYQLGLHNVAHYKWWSIEKKRWIDFVEIKFHSNENIEWHYMQLELNWIEFQVN